MKKALLAFLMLGILVHAPWRLMGLIAETMVVSPGATRTSQADDQYWQALDLEARLVSLGWEVSYAPQLSYRGQQAYGLTDPNEHTVQIDETLHWNARFAVLAHEGGHIMARGYLSTVQSEAFAESVAALVSHNGLREHARYLAAFRTDAILTMLVQWRAIYRAADVLEDL